MFNKRKQREAALEYLVGSLESVVDKLIFCKDCHHACHDADKPTLWRCHNSNWYKDDGDFCSRGEKRAEE